MEVMKTNLEIDRYITMMSDLTIYYCPLFSNHLTTSEYLCVLFCLTLLWYSFLTVDEAFFRMEDGFTVSQLNFAGGLRKKNSSGVWNSKTQKAQALNKSQGEWILHDISYGFFETATQIFYRTVTDSLTWCYFDLFCMVLLEDIHLKKKIQRYRF